MSDRLMAELERESEVDFESRRTACIFLEHRRADSRVSDVSEMQEICGTKQAAFDYFDNHREFWLSTAADRAKGESVHDVLVDANKNQALPVGWFFIVREMGYSA